MAEGEQNMFKMITDIYWTDLLKGCSEFTRQTDSGTGNTQDLCMANNESCPFYDGLYGLHGKGEPQGRLSRYDLGLGKGYKAGFCRLQKDVIRIGLLPLFDKRWVRPTPREEQK